MKKEKPSVKSKKPISGGATSGGEVKKSVTKRKELQLFKTEDNRSTFKKKQKSRKSAGNPTTSGGMPSTFSNPPTNLKNSD
jgi:hypothetical protein